LGSTQSTFKAALVVFEEKVRNRALHDLCYMMCTEHAPATSSLWQTINAAACQTHAAVHLISAVHPSLHTQRTRHQNIIPSTRQIIQTAAAAFIHHDELTSSLLGTSLNFTAHSALRSFDAGRAILPDCTTTRCSICPLLPAAAAPAAAPAAAAAVPLLEPACSHSLQKQPQQRTHHNLVAASVADARHC
jgi:hypothetical protein